MHTSSVVAVSEIPRWLGNKISFLNDILVSGDVILDMSLMRRFSAKFATELLCSRQMRFSSFRLNDDNST